ncbi:MAG: alginate lyase family protein [Sulfurifustis sp.]
MPTPNMMRRARPYVCLDAKVSRAPYLAAAERILAGRISVFARDCVFPGLPAWNRDPKTGRTAPLAFGKMLDYRDPATVGDIKYLWEPNRHLHLVTLAQAFRLSDDERYLAGLRVQIESWFDQCPYLIGPNWSSALEAAIRLINWSVVWQLIDGLDSALFADRRGQALRDRWLASVYQHMHFIRGHLSRYSSANNHLIGELAGVFIAAQTWPFWPVADRWRRDAKKRLIEEALLQNAPDGVNREQAISYQQFVLDFLLLSALAGRANGDDFPVEYWQRIERMLEFVAAVMDVSGNVPMIGDADDGYVVRLSQESGFCPYRSLLATGAILFGRSDFKLKAGAFDDKSHWLTGKDGIRKFKELKAGAAQWPRRFPEGGYYVLGSDFDTDEEVRIVIDAGPLGYRSIAAHGHADALAFTMSIGGREFLVDPGTYAYHTEREWRDYFRGTSAHNTVRVDDTDQSVPGGNFLWLKHARASCTGWEENGDAIRFVGEHDGYRRLADPVTHRRALMFDKHRKSLEVVDTLVCGDRHCVERYWHFAEDVDVVVKPDGAIEATKNGCGLRLTPQSPVSARTHRGALSPRAGWISRRFDVKTPASTVVWRSEIMGETQLTALIEWTVPLSSPLEPGAFVHDGEAASAKST